MDKLLHVVGCMVLITSVFAASLPNDGVVIEQLENDNDGLGNYKFYFVQSDGTSHQQTGQLKDLGNKEPFTVVEGSYTWISPENQQYKVDYNADEDGYRAHIHYNALENPYVVQTQGISSSSFSQTSYSSSSRSSYSSQTQASYDAPASENNRYPLRLVASMLCKRGLYKGQSCTYKRA